MVILSRNLTQISKKNSNGDCFITFFKDTRSVILNGRVTPQYNNFTFVSTRGSSVPDYMYCPVDQLESCTEMKIILMSEIVDLAQLYPPHILPDHSILLGTFKSFINEPYTPRERPIQPSCIPERPVKKNIKKMKTDFFLSDEVHIQVLETISKLETTIESQNELDRTWSEVKQLFMTELSQLPDLPVSQNKNFLSKFKKCKKFWNEELANCWKNVCNSEKQYLNFKVRIPADHAIKRDLLYRYKSTQKTFEAKYRFYKRKHKKQELADLEHDTIKNPQQMWSKLKQLGNPPSSKAVLEIIREDNSISTDIKEILVRWHSDISKLFSGLRDSPEFAFDDEFYNDIIEKKIEFESLSKAEQISASQYDTHNLNSEILYSEVSTCINNSKYKKAYLDIPNEALKNENAKLLLLKFFNLCFKSGLNPTDWDRNDIKPIPKKDKEPRDPLQNRCITIMCCVAKIYSSILTHRLQDYLEHNNLLVDEQNGFRAARSCIDHIFVLCTILRNRKSLGLDTFLAFIDYKKAFDSVDRNLLLYKLSEMGISGNFYDAISAMFRNPKSRVILNEYSTEYFDCPIGVKQGDCISATLFAIFINDLAVQIKESNIGIDLSKHIDTNLNNISQDALFVNILLYADDIVCMAESEIDLQQLLDIVESWCRKWRLEVNLTKTNILHVRPKRRQQSRFMFLFNHRPVEYCKYYRYLGATINEFIDYNYTAENLADSAGRALSAIICKYLNGGFPYLTYTSLIENCVNSISQYSSEVWGFQYYSSTQKLHLQAARFYLGLPKNAPVPAILADIGWQEPLYNTQQKMIRQYHRIMKMENKRLTKVVLLWDCEFNRHNRNISTWSSEIKEIMENYDLGYLGDNIQLFPLKETITTLKNKMLLKQRSSLELKCREKPQLRTYIQLKNFNIKPPIISRPLSFIQRKFLSKFMVSCLQLKICTGRYTNQPESDRICTVEQSCMDHRIVESECHFVLTCPAYHLLRQAWLARLEGPENFSQLGDIEKLNVAINDTKNVKATAQFIVDAFSLRSRILEMKGAK